MQLVPDVELTMRIKHDLVNMIAQQNCCDEFEDNLEHQPTKKMKRGAQRIQSCLSDKTAQVKFMLKNNVAYRRV